VIAPVLGQSPGSEVLEIVVPKRLESPNVTRGYHWRRRHRETMAWQGLIHGHAPRMRPLWSVETNPRLAYDDRGRPYLKTDRIPERRRVTITRLVPSRRNFIRDDDNLRFAAKPVNDALKRLGFLYDDTRTWLEQPAPVQTVDPQGRDLTVIRIERVLTPAGKAGR